MIVKNTHKVTEYVDNVIYPQIKNIIFKKILKFENRIVNIAGKWAGWAWVGPSTSVFLKNWTGSGQESIEPKNGGPIKSET